MLKVEVEDAIEAIEIARKATLEKNIKFSTHDVLFKEILALTGQILIADAIKLSNEGGNEYQENEMTRINLNCRAQVKLTELGRKQLDEYVEEIRATNKGLSDYKIDTPDNIFETMLWYLMNIFGKYQAMGNQCSFEKNEIYIIK